MTTSAVIIAVALRLRFSHEKTGVYGTSIKSAVFCEEFRRRASAALICGTSLLFPYGYLLHIPTHN